MKIIINEPGTDWTEEQLRVRAEADRIHRELDAEFYHWEAQRKRNARLLDILKASCAHEHVTEQPDSLCTNRTELICQVCRQSVGYK